MSLNTIHTTTHLPIVPKSAQSFLNNSSLDEVSEFTSYAITSYHDAKDSQVLKFRPKNDRQAQMVAHVCNTSTQEDRV
jgi:hypothetical protein